ncbi:hypothetical protein HHI36_012400 [Cryptolaemus montrouzieri]|uniref:Phosphodiesterase n=1 Tax=Cryptolaemus montrouzieri TaxID=559131 RepID=A0ABD2NE47_9CUCU
MYKKKYVYMFPQTFSAKRVVAPFNRKLLKSQTSGKTEMKLSYVKRYVSQESIGLNDLTDFSSDNPDLQVLLLQAAEILKNTTKATYASVYMVNMSMYEIYLLTGKQLVVIPSQFRFPIEEGKTIGAHVAFNKEYVMVEDIQEDKRFSRNTGFKSSLAQSVLCVPVVTPDGDCFAVYELMRTEIQPFTKDDLKITIVVTGWMGAAIHQNLQRVAMKKQETLHDHLLLVTKCFFQKGIETRKMVTDLVGFAKETLNVFRGSFYIIDKEYEELTADNYEEGLDPYNFELVKKNLKVKLLQKDRGIVTLVARSGFTINVKDPARDPRIGKDRELRTGKTIKSMLCMPIIGNGGLIGIFQLLNKRYGIFTKSDEAILKIFGIYASCCLQFNTLDERLHKQNVVGKIYIELLDKMLKPCIHEQEYFSRTMNMKLPTQFLDFKWYIPDAIMNDAPQLAVYMIKDLCGTGEIIHENLIKFILTTRKLYRNNPYHNFEHAFNFLHCMYGILKRNSMIFTPLETKALMIASICHDIDHGGLTNTFLMTTNDVIYQLYPESSWENYHYLVTAHLLELIQIYKIVSRRDYKQFLNEIKYAILATDLHLYFKNRLKLLPIINEDTFEISNSDHRCLLKTMMMTVCDLSGQCMPYTTARKITDNVYREFYSQGDKEKKLGFPPLSMMDRDKQHLIPEDQIQFLSVIVLPATEILKSILANTVDLYTECLNLQKTWMEILEARERKTKKKTILY